MKITVETGGEPNPQLEAFKAFVQKYKARIIVGTVAFVVLVAGAVFIVQGVADYNDMGKVQACIDEYKLPPSADDSYERGVCLTKVQNGVYP